MSDFKAKMHQIQFPLGLRPRPRWGSLQRSPDPLAGFGALLLRGGRGREGRGRGEGREGKERGLSLLKVNFLVRRCFRKVSRSPIIRSRLLAAHAVHGRTVACAANSLIDLMMGDANVSVVSHAEYVPTLTAAAALRVKAALSIAAWPGDLDL